LLDERIERKSGLDSEGLPRVKYRLLFTPRKETSIMICLRFREPASLALFMALALTGFAIAQEPRAVDPRIGYSRTLNSNTPESTDRSYKIYALDDFGTDPGFCAWVAQTIPEVIATGTWKGPGVIRYYAPKNILVVCHTAAVQAQVDGFLKDVKKSLSATTKARAAAPKSPTSANEVVPTQYFAPQLLVATNPASAPSHSSPAPEAAKAAPEPSLSYPVPAAAKPPKHLFHFIIRYEGEGIIDDSVVKVMKDYCRAQSKALQQASGAMPPAPAVTAPAAMPPAPAPAVTAPFNAPASPPSSPLPAVTVPGSVPPENAPAAPAPTVKEKEDKKEDKGTEKEKQTTLKTTRR
jgi:hypothetical protein